MGILFRYLLIALLLMLLLRALWRLLVGMIEGASPAARRSPQDRGVLMVRDPVCGTFVPPASAVSLAERGGAVHYFCSDRCREAYKARV
jgi:YHS domain-containing protein